MWCSVMTERNEEGCNWTKKSPLWVRSCAWHSERKQVPWVHHICKEMFALHQRRVSLLGRLSSTEPIAPLLGLLLKVSTVARETTTLSDDQFKLKNLCVSSGVSTGRGFFSSSSFTAAGSSPGCFSSLQTSMVSLSSDASLLLSQSL